MSKLLPRVAPMQVLFQRLRDCFLVSAVGIFAFAAIAKLIAPFTPEDLHLRDPFVRFLTVWQLSHVAAIVEMVVAVMIALSVRQSPSRGVGLTLWLAALFLLYRMGFHFAPNYPDTACRCFGGIGGIIGRHSDAVALGLLLYLLTFGTLLAIAPLRAKPPIDNASQR